MKGSLIRLLLEEELVFLQTVKSVKKAEEVEAIKYIQTNGFNEKLKKASPQGDALKKLSLHIAKKNI